MAGHSLDASPEQMPEYAHIPLVISFVSWSGVGKTTFLEKLVPELKKLGLRVGVLKHHAHATPFDVPGKDTYRLSEAGADIVVGASPVQTAIFIPGDASADLDAVIRRHLMDVDLVLLEGYSRGNYRKIEVYRSDRGGQDNADDGLLCDVTELLAVATDVRLALPETIRQFGLDDPAGVANLLSELALQR
ncbi:MAG: molybdopterin-guanine dinucleotide biosynthesis protein B [Chloroflexota bacterium]|jgi:molybdopterin-guanine dinucleotide biosynthesis protein B